MSTEAMADSISRGYTATPQGRIHYSQAGTGAPLILLHASPRSSRCFRRMLPLLAPHCRAIAIDNLGFGNSDPLPPKISMERLAESVVQFLDAMGIARASLFGLHTGNKIGAAMAAEWPARVDKVILAGQAHSMIADMATRNAEIRKLFEKYPPTYPPAADGAHHVRDWAATHAEMESLWWPQKLISGMNIEKRDIEDIEARVVDYLLGRQGIVPIYDAIFAFDFAAALTRIEAPTLVLELLAPYERHLGEQATQLCSLMKRAHAVRIPDADRSVLEARPADVVAPILEFLRT